MLKLCANCVSHTCRSLPQHATHAFADLGAAAPALASCATPVSRVCERLAAQPEALNAAMLDCEIAASTVPFERLYDLMHRLCYHVGLAADMPDRKAARMSRSLAVYVYMLDTARHRCADMPPSWCSDPVKCRGFAASAARRPVPAVHALAVHALAVHTNISRYTLAVHTKSLYALAWVNKAPRRDGRAGSVKVGTLCRLLNMGHVVSTFKRPLWTLQAVYAPVQPHSDLKNASQTCIRQSTRQQSLSGPHCAHEERVLMDAADVPAVLSLQPVIAYREDALTGIPMPCGSFRDGTVHAIAPSSALCKAMQVASQRTGAPISGSPPSRASGAPAPRLRGRTAASCQLLTCTRPGPRDHGRLSGPSALDVHSPAERRQWFHATRL